MDLRKVFIGLALSVLFLSGCSWLPDEDLGAKKRFFDTITSIANKRVGDSIEVDAVKTIGLQWDTLYVIASSATSDDISAMTGSSWHGAMNYEDDNLFIFKYRGDIKYYIKFNRLDFYKEDSFVKLTCNIDAGKLFTRNTAKFWLTRFKDSPLRIDLFSASTPKPVYRPAYGKYLQEYRQAMSNGGINVPELPVP